MSEKVSTIDGWVGYGDGADILLQVGQRLDASHPVVIDRPELFEDPAEETPQRKVPARAKPKAGDAP